MKKLYIYLTPILIAFAIMIIVNEYSRFKIDKTMNNNVGLMKINSAMITRSVCTWNCHNNTNYCKEYHVKWLKNYLSFIDPFYFGIISLLGKLGSYVMANLIFLVVVWPLLLSYLLVKSIQTQKQIGLLKQKHV